MNKEILTFGNIEIEKKIYPHNFFWGGGVMQILKKY